MTLTIHVPRKFVMLIVDCVLSSIYAQSGYPGFGVATYPKSNTKARPLVMQNALRFPTLIVIQ